MKTSTVKVDELGFYLQLDGFRARPSSTPDFEPDQSTVYPKGTRVNVETICAAVSYEVHAGNQRKEMWGTGCWYENGGTKNSDQCLVCNDHNLGIALAMKE